MSVLTRSIRAISPVPSCRAPRRARITGLPVATAAASIAAATAGSGGLEITTMTRVPSSAASSFRPARVISPPTAAVRSRPPTPMACETPTPAASSRQVTSWMPVPDAPTMPTGPRCTALANPSATPSMIAVPQSAPMKSSPSSVARRLSATSVSRLTPSEKQNTCLPASSAAAAS